MYNPRRWFQNRSLRPEHLVAVFLGLAIVGYGVFASLGGGRKTGGAGTALAATSDGPVRLAHFSYVAGNATWRPSDDAPWSEATTNLPIRQGSTVAVSGSGRAEVQFDDGSRMRLGNGAVVTMRSLYSDADGEYSELIVRDGSVDLSLRHDKSVYQIDAPIVSVDATGPAKLRIDAEQGVRVTVRDGSCTVIGDQGRQTIGAGEYIALRNADDPYRVATLDTTDNFDGWTAVRDRNEERALHSRHRRYLPRGAAIAADNLDDYGTWRDDPTYGEVWYPTVRRTGWRPYSQGHWVWVAPFGWTWVGAEPWGWAPYHYGTWVDESDGWAWVPGPAVQYWSPAIVRWYDDDDMIAWTPCGPREVYYPPSLSIGFSGGDWSIFFSIGGAADYYPTYGGYCEPRPWSTQVVNNYTVVNNYYGDPATIQNVSFSRTTVIPQNWSGATVASRESFAGRGQFAPLSGDARTFFGRSRTITAGTPVRPTANSFTATRTTLAGDPVSKSVLNRPVRVASDPRQGLQAARTFTQTGRNGGMVASTIPHGRDRIAAVRARSALGLATTGAAVNRTGQAFVGRSGGLNSPSAVRSATGRSVTQSPLGRVTGRNGGMQSTGSPMVGAAKRARAQVGANQGPGRAVAPHRQGGTQTVPGRRPAGGNFTPSKSHAIHGARTGGGGQASGPRRQSGAARNSGGVTHRGGGAPHSGQVRTHSPRRSQGAGMGRGRSQVTTHTRVPSERRPFMGSSSGAGRVFRGNSSGGARVFRSNPPSSRGSAPRGGGGSRQMRSIQPTGRGGGGGSRQMRSIQPTGRGGGGGAQGKGKGEGHSKQNRR